MRSWPITSMRVVGVVVVVFFVRDVLGGYFHGDLARLLAGCAWVLGICAHVHTYLVPAQALPGHFQHQTRPGAGARDWRSSRCRAASSGNPGPRRLYRSPRTLCALCDRQPGPLPPQGGDVLTDDIQCQRPKTTHHTDDARRRTPPRLQLHDGVLEAPSPVSSPPGCTGGTENSLPVRVLHRGHVSPAENTPILAGWCRLAMLSPSGARRKLNNFVTAGRAGRV